MKKRYLLTISVLTLVGCVNMPDFDKNEALYPTLTKEQIQQNVLEVFGTTFDSNHNWSSINTYSVSVKANANLKDIVKVQILTEAPFLNDSSTVLNEVKAQKGDVVTLKYDAPADLDQLIAACYDSNGKCYVQVFTPGQSSVSFLSSATARTRAAYTALPDVSSIILNKKTKSINAQRAEQKWNVWAEASGQQWLNDFLWEPKDGKLTNSWAIELGSIYREISGFSEGEEDNIIAICNKFMYKYGSDTNGKKNNLKTIRTSPFFSMEDNYLTTNGVDPVTLIPIQAYTTEFKLNEVYYYYFKPEQIEGMTDTQTLAFLKSLPKFKAIRVEKIETTPESNAGTLFHRREYLLPYYGDGEPFVNDAAVSTVFPKGYKIGFFNRKRENDNTNGSKNGCAYGDGRLNYETNHVSGHYLSAVDKSLGGNTKDGMNWTDPRIAIFSANDKTYMCFEDGADCNFCDMIIEVNGGTELIDETVEVPNTTYTFCFEDRQNGDYDMNDVIIKASRVDETHVKYSVVACGANDELYLRNLNGQILNENAEIHTLFGVNSGTFVNTGDGVTKDPVEEVFEVDKDFSFANIDKLPYLYNQTTNKYIYLSKTGEDPHGIIIPSDYLYPKERICIKDAYEDFVNWGENPTSSNRGWFRNYVEENVYK